MKIKILLIVILFPCFCLTAQTVSIPDPYFEQALIGLNIDSDGVVNGQVLASDVENVTELLLNNNNGSQITSLSGLEAFENIETLQVVFTQIAALDVSHNLRLKTLICNNNFLTDINVSSNILLENLTIATLAIYSHKMK
jgi:Leucine-rich repeat (LRR) protein